MPPRPKQAMRAALARLALDDAGLDTKRLEPVSRRPPLYRLRVGAWRAVYRRDPDAIYVTRIFRRDEGYGWMERMG